MSISTQLKNIETRTGKTLTQLTKLVESSGLEKHGELRQMLIDTLGMGFGDANTLIHHIRKSDGASAAAASGASIDDVLAQLYSGAKAPLRPIHDALMARIVKFGDFEIAPKKRYVSLRRARQFAMIGPATNTRVEVGLNATDLTGPARLEPQTPGGMCKYIVKVTDAKQVDAELIAWIRTAYDASA